MSSDCSAPAVQPSTAANSPSSIASAEPRPARTASSVRASPYNSSLGTGPGLGHAVGPGHERLPGGQRRAPDLERHPGHQAEGRPGGRKLAEPAGSRHGGRLVPGVDVLHQAGLPVHHREERIGTSTPTGSTRGRSTSSRRRPARRRRHGVPDLPSGVTRACGLRTLERAIGLYLGCRSSTTPPSTCRDSST